MTGAKLLVFINAMEVSTKCQISLPDADTVEGAMAPLSFPLSAVQASSVATSKGVSLILCTN